MNKWIVNAKSGEQSPEISAEEIIKVILKNRGLKNRKEIQNFLNPEISDINYQNAGMDIIQLEKAKKRIDQVMEKKEKVVVYMDYDADGICAGAIIWETLYKMKINVMPYIPERKKEGYGMSEEGLSYIRKEFNPTLIITVDHGITAYEHIKHLKEKEIDVIILDHHVKPEKLPNAYAIIHTTNLSSGAIAMIFSDYLTGLGFDYLELAAISTVGDLIPLIGINRTIVKFGLEQLNNTKRIGLSALISKSGLIKGNIEVYGLSHIIVPRINAMGRLTHAIDALRLLCTKDEERALKLADLLNRTNRERQLLTMDNFNHAKEKYTKENQKDGKNQDKLIFIGHSSYEEGVIGLIAGKLSEKHNLPAIVLSIGEIYSKASARSVRGLDIIDLIRKADDLIIDAGGHPMAAGFTLLTKNIEKLKNKLTKLVNDSINDELLLKKIDIDMELKFEHVTMDLYERIKLLSPFGVGNPEPLFEVNSVKALSLKTVGKEGNHLKLVFCQNQEDVSLNGMKMVRIGKSFDAIAFGFGKTKELITPDITMDIVFTIDKDDWNGNNRLQLKIKDVRILN